MSCIWHIWVTRVNFYVENMTAFKMKIPRWIVQNLNVIVQYQVKSQNNLYYGCDLENLWCYQKFYSIGLQILPRSKNLVFLNIILWATYVLQCFVASWWDMMMRYDNAGQVSKGSISFYFHFDLTSTYIYYWEISDNLDTLFKFPWHLACWLVWWQFSKQWWRKYLTSLAGVGKTGTGGCCLGVHCSIIENSSCAEPGHPHILRQYHICCCIGLIPRASIPHKPLISVESLTECSHSKMQSSISSKRWKMWKFRNH